jgi:DNA-directed RNA polymerase specialized sigma subunit
VFLGSEAFVDDLRRRLPKDRDLSEVPRAQRRPPAKPLAKYAAVYANRDEAIATAYASGGYTLKEIGAYFGLHYARVSRIVQAAKKAKDKTTP